MNTLGLGSECRWEALTLVLVGDLTTKELYKLCWGSYWQNLDLGELLNEKTQQERVAVGTLS